MKISYGITVYNEYKEIDNLLFHLSKHIRDEDEVVVTQDVSKIGTGVFEEDFQSPEQCSFVWFFNAEKSLLKLNVVTFKFLK